MDWHTTVEVAFGLMAGSYTGKLVIERQIDRKMIKAQWELIGALERHMATKHPQFTPLPDEVSA